MEDINGKKFSLQDWVMRRAANQSGSAVQPPLTLRRAENETDAAEEVTMEVVADALAVKVVSNGSGRPAPSFTTTQPVEKNAIKDESPVADNDMADSKEESAQTSTSLPQTAMSVAAALSASPVASAQSPLQQLQIVRLLTDLGDRLRQSEKEREILWKEVDTCRKMIAEMDGRGDKTEKAYLSLESQYQQGEDIIKNLLNKQAELEQKIGEQNKDLEESRKSQEKLVEKLSSVETATGSAMVRVEDAITENGKLSKRLEAMGQDKARLLHKLETMEDMLAQTQESLKAKALVLLTDQALATRTQLPQTPAWTGNDTLKMARMAAGEKGEQDMSSNPAAVVGASLTAQRRDWGVRTNTLILAGIIVTGILGGALLFNSMNNKQSAVISNTPFPTQETPATLVQQSKANQEQLMAEIAKMANDIEPSTLHDGDTAAPDIVPKDAQESPEVADDNLSELSPQFAKAQEAQDKAVADFDAETWSGTAAERIKADSKLPIAVKEIEEKALADNAVAQHDMAVIYTSGQGGVPINYARAQKWFLEAAHNGIANAQYNLGVLYHQGIGVQKDIPRAVQMYRVAAAANHPEALYNLAIAYIEGVGTENDPQVANVYFERAAAGGVDEAAYNLGLLHENGLLGESQPDEALFWYSLAAQKENKDAAKALAQLQKQLSMTDADVDRVVGRIAKQKPEFLDKDGNAALPEPKTQEELHSDLSSVGNDGTSKLMMSDLPPAVAIGGGVTSEDNDMADASSLRVNAPRSAIISQVEEQLIRLGYYMGVPNGRMTAQLEKSIKAYQKENGMITDGRATNDLLAHMLASGVEQQMTE